MGTVIGVHEVPLVYVCRTGVVVAAATALLTNKPYSEQHGSVEAELIPRVSHDHPVFGDDSVEVFNFLEEATIGTVVTSTIAPYKRSKDGRGAFFAVVSQHAGLDKWEGAIKTSETFLKSPSTRATSTIPLKSIVTDTVRTTFFCRKLLSMSKCSSQMKGFRVTYLLDSIECPDPYVFTALAQIHVSDPGIRTDFERSVTVLVRSILHAL